MMIDWRVIKFIKDIRKERGRIYHNPESSWAERVRGSNKTKIKRVFKTESAGYIQIDTIVRFMYAMKVYILNTIDIATRFQQVYPIKGGIHTVQTDNGSEFEGEFDKYLKEKGIKHLYSYSRCPKINA